MAVSKDPHDFFNFVISDVVERVEDKQLFYKYTKSVASYNSYDGQDKTGQEMLPPLIPNKRHRTVFEYTPCEELLTADWVEWTGDKKTTMLL